MPYRDFALPGNHREMTDSRDWVTWADGERLLPSVAPVLEGTCALCFGAVGKTYDGDWFTYCQHCHGYRNYLDRVVPVVYSLDVGFESLLHKYKDWENRQWLGIPLGCIAQDFFQRHLGCITEAIGDVDRFTVVPSGDTDRPFIPLEYAVDQVDGWNVDWDFGLVKKVREGRPKRGVADASFYEVSEDLDHETIVILDDTWTSGSSTASVAAALQAAGARRILAVTIGRQIHAGSDFGSAPDLEAAARERTYDPERCVLCG
jgi:predicted amidophosphoribosyltransferase